MFHKELEKKYKKFVKMMDSESKYKFEDVTEGVSSKELNMFWNRFYNITNELLDSIQELNSKNY